MQKREADEEHPMETKRELLARRGLILPGRIVQSLDRVGIYARPTVTLEHQHLAKRYVLRGVESGGAIGEMGRYVTFAAENGEPIPSLHPVDTLAVNGVHAVVVAPVLVRIELFRAGRTCQLLITQHRPGNVEDNRRPPLENILLFRGVDGILEFELWGKDRDMAGSVTPQFWSRAGERVEIPPAFQAGVRAATQGAGCVGCSHAHYLTGTLAPKMGLPDHLTTQS
jgi:hypothetical protein